MISFEITDWEDVHRHGAIIGTGTDIALHRIPEASSPAMLVRKPVQVIVTPSCVEVPNFV